MKDVRKTPITLGAWVAVIPSSGIKETETGEVVEIDEQDGMLKVNIYWAYHERTNPRQIRYRLITTPNLVLVLK